MGGCRDVNGEHNETFLTVSNSQVTHLVQRARENEALQSIYELRDPQNPSAGYRVAGEVCVVREGPFENAIIRDDGNVIVGTFDPGRNDATPALNWGTYTPVGRPGIEFFGQPINTATSALGRTMVVLAAEHQWTPEAANTLRGILGAEAGNDDQQSVYFDSQRGTLAVNIDMLIPARDLIRHLHSANANDLAGISEEQREYLVDALTAEFVAKHNQAPIEPSRTEWAKDNMLELIIGGAGFLAIGYTFYQVHVRGAYSTAQIEGSRTARWHSHKSVESSNLAREALRNGNIQEAQNHLRDARTRLGQAEEPNWRAQDARGRIGTREAQRSQQAYREATQLADQVESEVQRAQAEAEEKNKGNGPDDNEPPAGTAGGGDGETAQVTNTSEAAAPDGQAYIAIDGELVEGVTVNLPPELSHMANTCYGSFEEFLTEAGYDPAQVIDMAATMLGGPEATPVAVPEANPATGLLTFYQSEGILYEGSRSELSVPGVDSVYSPNVSTFAPTAGQVVLPSVTIPEIVVPSVRVSPAPVRPMITVMP